MKRKRTNEPESDGPNTSTRTPSLVNGIGKNKKKKLKKTEKAKKKREAKDALLGQKGIEASAYYIVPWCESSDWDKVCINFNKGNYDAVIQELTMWRERVPSLPIGAESTLFLLQAIVFDEKENQNVNSSTSKSKSSSQITAFDGSVDDQCRSLYSLAVVRYLNHISHLATKEMGENAPFQMFKLASHLNVPDWIVDLRHVVSHGSTLPSLEVLRLAADFMKSWLQDNYWVGLDNGTLRVGAEVLKTKVKPPKTPKTPSLSKEEKYLQITQTISCYLACRIYKIRNVKHITDPEITHLLPNQPWKIPTKQAVGLLKTQIANLFTTDPFLVCTAFSFELVPNDEFLTNFSTLLELPVPVAGKSLGVDNANAVFENLCELWAPLIDLLKKRSKVPQMCTLLTSVYIGENSTKNSKLFSALWLDHFLQILEEDEKNYPVRLKKILTTVLSVPDPVGSLFFPRLLKLLEKNLGPTKIVQLESLFSIWVDDGIYANENSSKVRKAVTQNTRFAESSKLFTVEHIIPNRTGVECTLPNNDDVGGQEKIYNDTVDTVPSRSKSYSTFRKQNFTSDWQLDVFSESYWRNIPLGGPA